MRVAALYDVHGMREALAAVLREVEAEAVDAIVVGGDVALGPYPAEVLAMLRAAGPPLHWIRGNCDRALGPDGVQGFSNPDVEDTELVWARARLDPAEIDFLATLPTTISLDLEGLGPTLFCHAAPRSDLQTVTQGTPPDVIGRLVAGVPERTVVAGHTHMQLDTTVDGVRWVNAGSVGMPSEDEVAAFWTLLGPDVDFRKTPFDTAAAGEAIAATDWTWASEFLAENLAQPVGRERATELLEARAAARGER